MIKIFYRVYQKCRIFFIGVIFFIIEKRLYFWVPFIFCMFVGVCYIGISSAECCGLLGKACCCCAQTARDAQALVDSARNAGRVSDISLGETNGGAVTQQPAASGRVSDISLGEAGGGAVTQQPVASGRARSSQSRVIRDNAWIDAALESLARVDNAGKTTPIMKRYKCDN